MSPPLLRSNLLESTIPQTARTAKPLRSAFLRLSLGRGFTPTAPTFGQDRTRTRLENASIQAEIDEIRKQQERLPDTYVLGDTGREEYLLLRSGLEKQIQELERRLGGPSYPLEDTLAVDDFRGSSHIIAMSRSVMGLSKPKPMPCT
jgi:hypothetical protein